MDRPKDKTQIVRAAEPRAQGHEPTASEVVTYLRKHPDFLVEHPELVSVLTPPVVERGDKVVDLQHFMLQRMRAEMARLKGQQRTLIATSRSNLTSQTRVHAAALAIIAARSFEQLLQVITTDLAVLLDVDVVTIGVETSGGPQPRLPMSGVRLLRTGTVDALLGADRDARLRADIVGDPSLFGSAAGLVRSAALLRLAVSDDAPVGLLCIGTRRPDKFHPGQGTELLGFLARTLEVTIAAWLDLAA